MTKYYSEMSVNKTEITNANFKIQTKNQILLTAVHFRLFIETISDYFSTFKTRIFN